MGAYFLLIWGVGVVEIVFIMQSSVDKDLHSAFRCVEGPSPHLLGVLHLQHSRASCRCLAESLALAEELPSTSGVQQEASMM